VEMNQSSSGGAASDESLGSPPNTLAVRLEARFSRKNRGGEQKKIQGFELNVKFTAIPGITIILGPSGAGKTTLLDCVAGLRMQDTGAIVINNRILFDSERKVNLAVQHRKVGYVFQDLALFPHRTATQNIQYGLRHLSSAERASRTSTILETFRIAHLRNRRPGEISGGERQRVALARALVTDPCVLLLDEPLSALDAPTKASIVDDLRAWNQAHRIPILYVTHNREEVSALGERVIVLERGCVTAQGTPQEVLAAPRQETVALLAGFENIFDAKVVATHEDRGTLTCRIDGCEVELETPLVRAQASSRLRIGIRAGDILLATVKPIGLSARNVLPGKLISITQRDMVVFAKIDCGVEMMVHLTLAARDTLQLRPEGKVWIIIKTYSCHLMARGEAASQSV
jgi:molybdate transport system ATP-binding protein